MTVLVTYMSLTGNTKKVADAIYEGIEGKKEIKPMDQVSSLQGYDLSFIGFPIHSFDVPPKAKDFMKKNAEGKKVALFFTHASAVVPEMPMTADLRKRIDSNVRAAGEGMNVVGTFDSQGVLAEDVAKRCAASPDPNIQMFAKFRPQTMGHPNADELSKAKAFGKEMAKK